MQINLITNRKLQNSNPAFQNYEIVFTISKLDGVMAQGQLTWFKILAQLVLHDLLESRPFKLFAAICAESTGSLLNIQLSRKSYIGYAIQKQKPPNSQMRLRHNLICFKCSYLPLVTESLGCWENHDVRCDNPHSMLTSLVDHSKSMSHSL